MRRLILAGLLVALMATPALSQSNLYKMRNGNSVTPMGQELIVSTNTMCTEFTKIESHFNAMTRQRDGVNTFDTVAAQWGTLDASTNAISESVADNMYNELNAFIGASGPALRQWCSSIKQ